VGDVDLVDQAELIDVDRDLGVKHRLELFDQLVGQRIQLLLRQGRRRLGNRGGVIHYAKKACVLTRASTKRSASSSVLDRAKEARGLEVAPKRASGGWAHCVPARTATP